MLWVYCSAGIDFSRQNLTFYRCQILTTEVDPRAVRFNVLLDPYEKNESQMEKPIYPGLVETIKIHERNAAINLRGDIILNTKRGSTIFLFSLHSNEMSETTC